MRHALLGFALAFAGCFSPSYDNGALLCGPNKSCPEGYVCADNDRCYKPDALPDLSAPVDLSASVDLSMGCPATQHNCGGSCVSNNDVNSCGVSCTPCAAIDHATASCDGTSCQYACDVGYRICGGACLSTTDDSDCNGTCNAGFHLCGGLCVSDSDVNNCGTLCTPCVPAVGSAGAALCLLGAADGGTGYGCFSPTCATDNDCDSTSYCDQNGACQPRKAQGGACNTTADCKVAGCRECAAATAGCVDGFCCDTACNGSCDACSVAAGGAVNGTCSAIAPGSAGTPSCAPYVCNGAASCPNSCASDADCDTNDYCGNAGACQPRKAQGGACNTTTDCKVAGCRECGAATAGCVDGFCCNTACTGSCNACSVAAGGATDGTCGIVGAGSTGAPSCAPYLCDGASASCPTTCAADTDCVVTDYCDNTGHCSARKAQGGACNTTTDCKVAGCRECDAATAGCVDGFCCNTTCTGSCNACSVAAGGATNGTCGIVGAGSAGAPSCAPYLCDGASASCPTTCAADTDCVAADYCDNTGHCSARKAQGGACNTTTDCKVAGCRECDAATAGCVDGFCCSSACTGACNACSVAAGAAVNGTCAVVGAGNAGAPSCAPYVCDGLSSSCPTTCLADADCAAADYCDNTGHCQARKAQGGACNTTTDCKVAGCRECDAATGGCVDGFCCDTTCTGSCDACSVAAGGAVDGTCGIVGAGSAGAPSCAPYLCDGLSASCPSTCAADADCAAADYCDNTGHCQARKAQGGACNTTTDCKVAGCRECDSVTAGCVDGFCCDTTCSGSCDACSVAAGAATDGTCGIVIAGSAGAPSCGPYVCDGASASCPSTCAGDADCDPGAYCDNTGACVAQKITGDPCDTTADCKVAGCRECVLSCMVGTNTCS